MHFLVAFYISWKYSQIDINVSERLDMVHFIQFYCPTVQLTAVTLLLFGCGILAPNYDHQLTVAQVDPSKSIGRNYFQAVS